MSRGCYTRIHQVLWEEFPVDDTPEVSCLVSDDRGNEDEDVNAILKKFGRLRWDQVTGDAYRYSALALLTDDAYVYYIPGIMKYVCEHPDDVDASEAFVDSVNPYSYEGRLVPWKEERLQKLTDRQGSLIRELLRCIKRSYFCRRSAKDVKEALAYWNVRLDKTGGISRFKIQK